MKIFKNKFRFDGLKAAVFLLLAMSVASQAAVLHTKTNFYKNLEMGIPQKIALVGTSISSSNWGNLWNERLVNALNARFQNNVAYYHKVNPAGNDAFMADVATNYVHNEHPDLVIFEIGIMNPSNYVVNLGTIIRQTRLKNPKCEILFWQPYPTTDGKAATQRTNVVMARKMAADSSIYWVETFTKMDSIYTANSSVYNPQYLFDGFHPSVKCGDSIIIPAMLKTIMGKDLINNSVVSEPDFSPVSGEYSTPQTVTMSSTTSGASIRYTTDGSDPSTSSSATTSTSPATVTISSIKTLKAQAFKSDMTSSNTVSVLYAIRAVPPTFSLYPSGYASGTQISLSSSLSGATIRYTTNGTEPTKTSGTIYATGIPITKATMIKAVAYTDAMDASRTASGVYFVSDSIYSNSSTITTGRISSGSTTRQTPLLPCMFSPSSSWNKMVLEFDYADTCGLPNGGEWRVFTLFDQGPALSTSGGNFPSQCLAIGHAFLNFGICSAVQVQCIYKKVNGRDDGKPYYIPKKLPFEQNVYNVSYKFVFTKVTGGKVELSYKILKGQEEWGPFVDTLDATLWSQISASGGRNISAAVYMNAAFGKSLNIKNIRVTRMRDTLTPPPTVVQTAAMNPDALQSRITQNAAAFIVLVGEQGKHNVAVYDVKGKVVFSAKGTGIHQYTIPRNSMSSGFYMVQIKTRDKMVVKALTKCVE